MSDAHDSPAAERSWVRELGAALVAEARAGRDLYGVLQRTVYWTFRGRREPGAVAQQLFDVGNRSLFFVTVTLGFIGMILVFQSGLQAQRVLPDLSLMGATFIEALIRDLASTLTAMMLATRVGAGIAAEIGSMVVTEQVDALRMCGVDPVDYLIVPRFIASLVMTTVLILWAGAVAIATGCATAYFSFGLQPHTFLNASLIDVGDVVVGLSKCVAYGAAIPVVSGWCGLSTHGGSEGVGWATTRAVVSSSLAVITLDFILSAAGFLVFPP